ncbi:sugar ABC transporter ATP-binding protein [Arthrobacter sp. zg-Y826]|uniref:sugar ABC transporter ATP-binding protein n=1 Tax=Arthrobacter jinronghuae TaxID=2964609 RepID=UPI002102E009|nr:sugar ABC transporter ATP-binding protein [Arthrobacter jinronghuae]MCQ1957506.1 sugar ABC transporter ATP-binding protein [Arthrobacter jinronghuae]
MAQLSRQDVDYMHRNSQGPVLTLTGISKSFGGVAALRDISLELFPGEVHALVGMNGAGKSTLVGVLSGAHAPDAGVIELEGNPLAALTPRRAREHGVATVPQKRDLVLALTVTENLFLGQLPRRAGLVDWRRAHRLAEEALRSIGIGEINPRVPVEQLTVAEQTMVEIAREVRHGGKILILDEPTASLGGSAAMQVRNLVRRLRDQGTAVVYISHHLDELHDVADRITVLRDGQRQLTVAKDKLTVPELVYAMAGEHVDAERPTRAAPPGERRLRIDKLTVHGALAGFSLEVHAGEVVAVLGPAGHGQTALFPALSGLRRPASGAMSVMEKPVRWGNIRESLASGLRCIPGDRLAQGVIGALTLDENIVLARDHFDGRRLVNWRALARRARQLRDRFGVVTLQRNPPIEMLSGGNQQKALLGKWLDRTPPVVFLEEPTNGVDVAAKADIHRMVDDLASQGAAVLLVSSDIEEVLRLADRIAVVHGNRLVAHRDVGTVSRDELIALTVGDTENTPGDKGVAPTSGESSDG